jgi:hypothetical protein
MIQRPVALLWVLWAAIPVPSLGADPLPDPLPDPLTIDQALALAERHPRQDASPALTARLPPRHPLYLDCHSLAFGNAAADPGRGRPVLALTGAEAARRLEVLERYFDVLVAELAYSRYDEAMAVAYVQLDRASQRRELGQVSSLRVLELDSVYQQVLQDRAASEIGRQLTRALLAQALNRPDALPRDLVSPELPTLPDPLPSLGTLLGEVSARNPAPENPATSTGDADRARIDLELRQQVLELLLRLRALAAAQRRADTESAYRDLKLDESRTLYEQEVAADLGYSMSQQTMTRMLEARVGYCRALAWAELNALTGAPVWPETK